MTVSLFKCYVCKQDFTKINLTEFDQRDLCHRCMFTEQREEDSRMEVYDNRQFQPESRFK